LWIAELLRKVPSTLTEPSVSVLHDLLLRIFNGPAIDGARHMVQLAATLIAQPKLLSTEQVRSLLSTMLTLADRSLLLLSCASRQRAASYLELIASIFKSFAAMATHVKPDALAQCIRPHGVAITRILLRVLESSKTPASWTLRGNAAKYLIPVLDRLLTRDELLHWGPLLHAQLKAGVALEERDNFGQLSVRTTDLRCDVFEAWAALVRVMRDDFIGGLWDCVEAIEWRMAPDYWKAKPPSVQSRWILEALRRIHSAQGDEEDDEYDDSEDHSDEEEQKEQEVSHEPEEEEEDSDESEADAEEQKEAEEKEANAAGEKVDASMANDAAFDADESIHAEGIDDSIEPRDAHDNSPPRESSDDERMTEHRRR
jgi:hypothetical protein